VAIIISEKPKLSLLKIDIDKNWAGHSIGNLKGISYSGIFELTNWGTKFDVNGGILNILGEAGTVILNADQSFDITSTNAGITIGAKGDITVYPQPPSRLVLQGEGENLFRIERKGEPDFHIVDSITQIDTQKFAGTRYAILGNNDYHFGIGLTLDTSTNTAYSGIVSTNNFGMTTTKTSPYEITGIGFGMSGYDGYVRYVDCQLDNYADDNFQPYFGIRCRSTSFPFLGMNYPDNINYIVFTPKTVEGGTRLVLHQTKSGDIIKYVALGTTPDYEYLTLNFGEEDGLGISCDVSLNGGHFLILPNNDTGTYAELYAYADSHTSAVVLSAGSVERQIRSSPSLLEIMGDGELLLRYFSSFNLNNIPVVNVSSLTGSAIGITTTSGDITLTTAGSIAMNLGNRKLSVFPVSDGIQIQPISGNLYLYATMGDLYFYGNTGIHLNYRELKEVGGISGDYGIIITTGSSFRIDAIEVIIDHEPIYLDGDYKETAIIHDTNLDMIKFTKGIKVMGWGISVPTWTNSTRPSVPVGEYVIGFNTDTHQFEGWDGSTWVILG